MYRPKNDLDRLIFPNLGKALITGGVPDHIGKIGVIVQEDDQCARIVFDSFWDRPPDCEIDAIDDNTWCFSGEYERLT